MTKPFSRSELLRAVATQLQKYASTYPSKAEEPIHPVCPPPTDLAQSLQQIAAYLQAHRETLTPDETSAIAIQLQALAQRFT